MAATTGEKTSLSRKIAECPLEIFWNPPIIKEGVSYSGRGGNWFFCRAVSPEDREWGRNTDERKRVFSWS